MLHQCRDLLDVKRGELDMKNPVCMKCRDTHYSAFEWPEAEKDAARFLVSDLKDGVFFKRYERDGAPTFCCDAKSAFIFWNEEEARDTANELNQDFNFQNFKPEKVEPPKAVKIITDDELRVAIRKKLDEGINDEIWELMKKYGSRCVSQLAQEKRADFLRELDGLKKKEKPDAGKL